MGGFLKSAVYQVSVATHQEAWRARTPLGSYNNHLYAINATMGGLQFRFAAPSTVHATPIITNSRVYFGCGTKYYAISATNGAQ